MNNLIDEAKRVKDSIENKEKLPLSQYHVVAPFLGDMLKSKYIFKLVRRAIRALEKYPYPFTAEGVNSRWDAVSLLSSFSSYIPKEMLEAIAFLFWENLRSGAPPVRANAALALFEISYRLTSKTLRSLMMNRLQRLIKRDQSRYVRFWAKLALKNLANPKMVNPFKLFDKPNPLTGIKSSKLFHRFLRLWATGNFEFYQGDFTNTNLPFSPDLLDRFDERQIDELVAERELPLPLSLLQFLTDVANGGQLARMTGNLFLLHNQQWLENPESDAWSVPWITILPAKPRWVSKPSNDEEFIPDELGSISISQVLIESGDEQFSVAMQSYITIATCENGQIVLNPDAADEPTLAYFNVPNKTLVKHNLTFPLWINNPTQLAEEQIGFDFSSLR